MKGTLKHSLMFLVLTYFGVCFIKIPYRKLTICINLNLNRQSWEVYSSKHKDLYEREMINGEAHGAAASKAPLSE